MSYIRRDIGMLIHVMPEEAYRRVVEALKVHDGSQVRAARHLGVAIETFYRWRKKLLELGYPITDTIHQFKFDAQMRKVAERNARAREYRKNKAS